MRASSRAKRLRLARRRRDGADVISAFVFDALRPAGPTGKLRRAPWVVASLFLDVLADRSLEAGRGPYMGCGHMRAPPFEPKRRARVGVSIDAWVSAAGHVFVLFSRASSRMAVALVWLLAAVGVLGSHCAAEGSTCVRRRWDATAPKLRNDFRPRLDARFHSLLGCWLELSGPLVVVVPLWCSSGLGRPSVWSPCKTWRLD